WIGEEPVDLAGSHFLRGGVFELPDHTPEVAAVRVAAPIRIGLETRFEGRPAGRSPAARLAHRQRCRSGERRGEGDGRRGKFLRAHLHRLISPWWWGRRATDRCLNPLPPT